MYKDNRPYLNPRPMFEEDEMLQAQLYDIAYQPSDPFYTQEFACNENGWPASDLQMILRNQNENVVNQLLAKIEQRAPDYLAADISFDDAVNLIVPRNIQTFAETERFVRGLTSIAKRLNDSSQVNSSEKIAFDSADTDATDIVDKV